MSALDSQQITGLLKAWGFGEDAALDRLIPLVYRELKRMARRYRRTQDAGASLQTTALVHEAYLRLVDVTTVTWQERSHFYAVSAQIMRRIMVDAARARRSGARSYARRSSRRQAPLPAAYAATTAVPRRGHRGSLRERESGSSRTDYPL